MVITTPLRYPGGKAKAIKKIIKYLPHDFSEYREPFVGGGSLFIYLKQKQPYLKIWINDLNTELFLFWKVVQLDCETLVKEVRKIKCQHTNGRLLFDTLATTKLEECSELQRAVRFYVLNRISFSGTVDAGGFSLSSFQGRFTDSAIERLSKLNQLLGGKDAVTNLDYSEVLETGGKDVFMFLDPPYWVAIKSKLYGKRGSLHTSFDHVRFAEALKNCKHKWLITYDDSPQIRHNFKWANIFELQLQYSMNNYKQVKAEKGKELIITNYDVK
jgi:DNA adenine methylase